MSKQDPCQQAPEEIDRYLEAFPDDFRSNLTSVRDIIRKTVPDCRERISNKIRIFLYGKTLVGISAQKRHCSLHSLCPALMKSMVDELKDVKVFGALIHFTTENSLSSDIIERIVRECMKEVHADEAGV
jgi:uncharacterized protein YdhG (YjbR/CyaY superfamily)